jgi:hypothetical protein
MVHKASRPGLKSVRNAAIVITAGRDIPPKLPDTTNLVFTRSRNEYREMIAMAESVIEENKSPPLKKLTRTINQRTKVCTAITYAFPKNKTPVPTNDFKSYDKRWARSPHVIE